MHPEHSGWHFEKITGKHDPRRIQNGGTPRLSKRHGGDGECMFVFVLVYVFLFTSSFFYFYFFIDYYRGRIPQHCPGKSRRRRPALYGPCHQGW